MSEIDFIEGECVQASIGETIVSFKEISSHSYCIPVILMVNIPCQVRQAIAGYKNKCSYKFNLWMIVHCSSDETSSFCEPFHVGNVACLEHIMEVRFI